MTTAATLGNVFTGYSSNDGTGITIKDAFDLVNTNTYKLNLQLNSSAENSNLFPATFVTLTGGLYANTGVIQGETINGSEIFVNGSPVLTSTTGGWNGGTIPYYGIFANTDASTSTTTGVVQVAGGVGIQGNLNVGGKLNVANDATLQNITTGNVVLTNINSSGNAVVNRLYTVGTSDFLGTTNFVGPVNVNGSININTPLNVNGDQVVTGVLSANGDFYANGAVRISTAQIATVASRSIQVEALGNVTPGTGAFTTLTTNNLTTVTNTTPSTSSTSGALTVAGGAGIAGDLYVGGTVFATNLAAITSQTLIVQDPLVYLESNSASYNYEIGVYSNYNAGVWGTKHSGLVRDHTDNVWKLFSNVSAPTSSAVSFTNVNYDDLKAGNLIATGNITGSIANSNLVNSGVTTLTTSYGISAVGTAVPGGTVALTNTGVTQAIAGTGVSVSGNTGNVTVSIGQAVGTANSPSFVGLTVASIAHSGSSGTGDIGSSSNTFGTVYATATSAKYADLAENYKADSYYEPGTVVAFGGAAEVTAAEDGTRKVAGVVSTDPAYLMNSCCDSEFVVAVALQGRVPVKVRGRVEKGDMMVSAGAGFARADYNPILGSVIGKAIEDFNGIEGVIEIVVGRL